MGDEQETQSADTSETMSSPVGQRRALFPEQPRPSLRADRELWSAGERAIPSFACNPWDFYEKFIELRTGSFLVLCNDRSTVRVIHLFGEDTHAEDTVCNSPATICSSPANSARSVSAKVVRFPLLPIRHQNFVAICEAYLFNHQIFAITEYAGFSLETLLQRGICPLEREIAYIISQAS